MDKSDFPQTDKDSATQEDDKPAFDPTLDHDGDGFTSAEELSAGTDPMDKTDFPQTETKEEDKGSATQEDSKPAFDPTLDHDGDGFTSKEELDANTNPVDKSDFPATPTGPVTQPTPPVADQPAPPAPTAGQAKPTEPKAGQPTAPAPSQSNARTLPTTGESWNLFHLFGLILTSTALLTIARKRQQD